MSMIDYIIATQPEYERQQSASFLLDAFHEGFSPPFSGSIYEWARNNIALPTTYQIPGAFDVSRSRYMIQPFDDLKDHTIRQVNLQWAVQLGKSVLAEIFAAWKMVNDAGNMLWLHQTIDAAKDAADSRINPILRSTKEVKDLMPTDRYSQKKLVITLPHMNLFIKAANESSLQSRTIKNIIMDECWLYDSGFIIQGKARAAAYPKTKKILCVSQAGLESSDWDKELNKGKLYRYGWVCPKCNNLQPWEWNIQRPDEKWAGIIWNKVNNPDNTTNIMETSKTARLQCYHCDNYIKDTPVNRRMLNDSGSYICVKEDGDPETHSYTVPSMANIDISFASLVVEYLQAKHDFEASGYIVPLQEFYTKKLAKSWDDNCQIKAVKLAMSEYDINADIPDEKFRFLTVDCQQDLIKFYLVVRSWAEGGKSRLLHRGWVSTFEAVREIQTKYKIKDQHVFLDSGYEATKIYQECVNCGHEGMLGKVKHWFSWNALKGMPNDSYYTVTDPTTKQRIRSPVSGLNWADPGAGQYKATKRCPLYLWSNDSIKDMLRNFRDKKAAEWLVPSEDEEYNNMMNSEYKKKTIEKGTGKEKWMWVKKSSKTRNEAWDCEAEQLVAAWLTGIIKP